ncbi:MAG: MFS transporter [Leptolyngbya sp. SIOISBB]|nr:MFS transporter [Leptolyngbya sp. SIOISBB]
MSSLLSRLSSNRLRIYWLLYTTGFLGLFLINGALTSVILYRYDPGSNSDGLAILVPTAIVGTALFAGRILGAFSQPVAGHISDNSSWKWGKRRPFIAMSTWPMVASFALLFNPLITESSEGKNLYLISLISLFYLAFSLYQVTYLAWLPELASQDTQRLTLSGWLAIASLLGIILGGAGTPWLVENYGFTPMTIIIGLVSLGTLLLPLLVSETVDRQPRPNLSLFVALKASWENPSFRPYVLAVSSAWVSMSILSVSPTFFAIALFHQDIGFGGLVTLLILGGAAIGMLGIKPLVKKFGKKKALQLSMIWLGIGTMLLSVIPIWLGKSFLPLYLVLMPIGCMGLGGFFILPNAMISDVIACDVKLDHSAQAIYFGGRGLFMELSIGLGVLLAGWLLSLGKTATQPLGVQLSLVAAGFFAFASAKLLVAYPIAK